MVEVAVVRSSLPNKHNSLLSNTNSVITLKICEEKNLRMICSYFGSKDRVKETKKMVWAAQTLNNITTNKKNEAN